MNMPDKKLISRRIQVPLNNIVIDTQSISICTKGTFIQDLYSNNPDGKIVLTKRFQTLLENVRDVSI